MDARAEKKLGSSDSSEADRRGGGDRRGADEPELPAGLAWRVSPSGAVW